ncbi:MCE family protein [Mycobacterium colombiense]
MDARHGKPRLHPGWWALILVGFAAILIGLSAALFSGSFNSYVSVTVKSDRAGLVMETGSKVKMRGVQVGRVTAINAGMDSVSLQLQIFPEQVKHIPANVQAQIQATTAFGAKYVDLIPPDNPSAQRITAGAVVHSRNVSTEVNTVFENLVGLLHHIDPGKLNAVLSAVAEGVRGKGARIGQSITDAKAVLDEVNPRMDVVRQDWRSLKGFSGAYASAADDILKTLSAASVTSSTVTNHAGDLDALLLNVIGLSQTGRDLLEPNEGNLVQAINGLRPTTDLLFKYLPEYTCTLQGAKFYLDNGGYQNAGGNGYSSILDASILLGSDPYRYPDNLPIIGAKGGPGGKPGCGSLPDVSKNFPVRAVVTDTGWGTGLDYRPNPGLAHPWWGDFLPVTRGTPEPPSIRGMGPPAIGPVPYPGAPPYGAQLYAPDGTPLWPGLPPAPPPGAPRDPGRTPGSEPFTVPVPAGTQPTPAPPPPAVNVTPSP